MSPPDKLVTLDELGDKGRAQMFSRIGIPDPSEICPSSLPHDGKVPQRMIDRVLSQAHLEEQHKRTRGEHWHSLARHFIHHGQHERGLVCMDHAHTHDPEGGYVETKAFYAGMIETFAAAHLRF